MQRMIIKSALVAPLLLGIIGFHIDYGVTPAHAQGSNIAVSLSNVKTGLCGADDIYTIAIHGGLSGHGGKHADKTSYMKPLLSEARSSLASGARAIDVVEAVISRMEDSGLFVSPAEPNCELLSA